MNENILQINLENEEIQVKEVDSKTIKKFIGGIGLGFKFLWEKVDENTDPLSSRSPLIFMNGPLTGTPAPCSGKHAVLAKSPLTGVIGESISGGNWGSELRKAGFLGIIIKGKAEDPVYLSIDNEDVEIKDASSYWRLDTYEVNDEIQEAMGEDAVVACIGQAGENEVLISSIMHEGNISRAAARCGLGAVMGSKNLKAVAVKGGGEPFIAEKEKLQDFINSLMNEIIEGTSAISEYGTSGLVNICEELGDLPTKNWRKTSWDKAENISGMKVKEITTGKYGCYMCPIVCGRKISVDHEKYGKMEGRGPEYETLAALGSSCLVDDLMAVVKGNELCDQYGLDTISTGSVIAFAMEASEKGLIDEDIEWGDEDAVLKLIEDIAKKEGLGEILGKGVARASEIIGGNSEEWAVEVKGLEPTMHDPRAFMSQAISYATGNRGPDHLQSFSHPIERDLPMGDIGYPEPLDRHSVENKADLAVKMQNLMYMFDSLVLCKFLINGGINTTILSKWLTYVTGLNFDKDTFMKAGERIFNLGRMFNIREGVSKNDDTLHPRFSTAEDKDKQHAPPMEKLLDEYYNIRGWTEEGHPKEEKLEELGLNDL